jgi:DNA topoisomerase I
MLFAHAAPLISRTSSTSTPATAAFVSSSSLHRWKRTRFGTIPSSLLPSFENPRVFSSSSSSCNPQTSSSRRDRPLRSLSAKTTTTVADDDTTVVVKKVKGRKSTTATKAKEQPQEQQHSRPFRLVIVESPSKCKTIQEILNLHVEREKLPYDFRVESCMGHVRNLPQKKKDYEQALALLSSSSSSAGKKHNDNTSSNIKSTTMKNFPYSVVGIDLQDNYRPTYVLLPGKEQLVEHLRSLSHAAEQVLLATDPDREGEAMAWHLMKVLSTSSSSSSQDDDIDTTKTKKKQAKKHERDLSLWFHRISFTEITQDAILESVMAAEHQHSSSSSSSSSSSKITSSLENRDDADDSDDIVEVANLNPSLVQAQETRRILDRLAGFTVSPILWKKITPGLSAGRVQSVGLARIVERERERLEFERTAYSTVKANFSLTNHNDDLGTDSDSSFSRKENDDVLLEAQLISVNGAVVANAGADFASQGQRLKPEASHKLHLQEADAHALMDQLLFVDHDNSFSWSIVQVKSTTRQQSPPLPYRTSTLQQDAARQLGMSIQDCMRTAQQLYEAGFISYMRTDATHLSTQAASAIEKAVTASFGKHQFNPKAIEAATSSKWQKGGKSKKDKKENKFAQEAHEAIRPSVQNGSGGFLFRLTDSTLSDAAKKLYDMIYRRTLACGMANRISNQTQITIEGIHGEMTVQFRASGSVVLDPGYTLAYGSATSQDEPDVQLPQVQEGQDVGLQEVIAIAHETQPPPRFTEASLVKELEALGVGRPSTYATIIKVLRDRAYVGNPIQINTSSFKQTSRRRGKAPVVCGPSISSHRAAGGDSFTSGNGSRSGALVPSLSALVVYDLLKTHCPSYVDPDFTARMEERLDRIASGEVGASEDERVAYLDEFYAGEHGLAAQVKRIDDVVDANEARRVRLPALEYHHHQVLDDGSDDDDGLSIGVRGMGERAVSLFVGPWGPYVQHVQPGHWDAGTRSPSVALPPELCADISAITPRTLNVLLKAKQSGGMLLGTHPEDGRSILLKTGRYGAFLQWGEDDEEGTTTHSLPKHKASATATIFDSLLTDNDSPDDTGYASAQGSAGGLTLEEAVGYTSLPRAVSYLNDLPITASLGPYGPYLKYNSSFLSLDPQDYDVLTIDKDIAERLVTEGIINGKRKQRGVVAELGEKGGSKVIVKEGRFGRYINWKKVNAKIPSAYTDDPSQIPLEEAWALIAEKAGSPPSSRGRKGTKTSSSKLPSIGLPPPPKRPLSAYMLFCSDRRAEITKTESSFGAVAKKLSQLWAESNPEERKPYETKAASDKVDYEERKRAWEEECMNGGSSSNKSGATKSRMEPNGTKRRLSVSSGDPKRPKSAYLFFCEEQRPLLTAREQSQQRTLGDIAKELGKLWSETTNRSLYESLAAADKERYNKEKEEQKRLISA